MRFLLDALNDCALAGFPKPQAKHPATAMTSAVSRLFGGYLRSQVRCLECHRGSNTYDPFLDLSLEVARCKSLEHALAHFTAPEMLEGDNKYRCSRCDTKVRARKQLTLFRTPPVLCVHLKRFEFSGFGGGNRLFGGFGGKLNHHVHFPAVLNLSPYVGGGNNVGSCGARERELGFAGRHCGERWVALPIACLLAVVAQFAFCPPALGHTFRTHAPTRPFSPCPAIFV